MTRTFIALELNEALQCHLERVISQVAQALPGVRWVNPAGIHLTLAFLGELDAQRLTEAKQAAERTAQQVISFSYRLSRLGIFGSFHHPRVIWMGIDEPSGVLPHLHRVLTSELEQQGFRLDQRAFSPHLTLAYLKNPLPPQELQQLQQILKGKQQDFTSSAFYTVRHITVMKSELLRTGARYTLLQEYPLQSKQ